MYSKNSSDNRDKQEQIVDIVQNHDITSFQGKCKHLPHSELVYC